MAVLRRGRGAWVIRARLPLGFEVVCHVERHDGETSARYVHAGSADLPGTTFPTFEVTHDALGFRWARCPLGTWTCCVPIRRKRRRRTASTPHRPGPHRSPLARYPPILPTPPAPPLPAPPSPRPPPY